MSWVHAAALKNFGPLDAEPDEDSETSDDDKGELEKLLARHDDEK